MFSEEQKEALNESLKPEFVAEREQSGRLLSYVEGHHVIQEANRIFGHGMWDRKTCELNVVQVEQKENSNKKLLWYIGYTCRVRIYVSDDKARGASRDGVGFGQGIDSDLGRAHESAIKEAETDAMKRAMVTFGNPFGLELYDKKSDLRSDNLKKSKKEQQSKGSVDAQSPPKKPEPKASEEDMCKRARIYYFKVHGEAGLPPHATEENKKINYTVWEKLLVLPDGSLTSGQTINSSQWKVLSDWVERAAKGTVKLPKEYLCWFEQQELLKQGVVNLPE